MIAQFRKGQRVGEVVTYGVGLTRTNPGIVMSGNARGARVKFDHRDNVMWVPRRDLISLEPNDKEQEAEAVKLEPKYPAKAGVTVTPSAAYAAPTASVPPPAPTPQKEVMPAPVRPQENILIERLRDQGIDAWDMLFKLRDALKEQGSKELSDAQAAVKEAEAEVEQAEALLAECRRKVGACKLKVADVQRKIDEVTKRLV